MRLTDVRSTDEHPSYAIEGTLESCKLPIPEQLHAMHTMPAHLPRQQY
jgi:hypothetical protein